MSPEDQERLEAVIDTCSSKGWKYILEDFVEDEKQADSLHSVNTMEGLFRHKGRLDVIAKILTYKEFTERALDEVE